MTITKTVEVFIDIDEIIERNTLSRTSTVYEINRAVDDYIAELDDCDYCLLKYEEKRAIRNAVFTEINLRR